LSGGGIKGEELRLRRESRDWAAVEKPRVLGGRRIEGEDLLLEKPGTGTYFARVNGFR
jgi:hypothetical protein